ncbi:hypothetical protein ACQR35_01985 [Pseudarthrobacter sp. J1738]|uniref:hypothetical protein n=1 Tax=unclassified Pseudarthrobacter TaxID=2647000 RepID=UPI003D2DE4D7
MSSNEPNAALPPRVGTIVWGLLIVALAALIIVSQLGVIALNGSYVAIGVMIGAGLALLIGGIVSGAAERSRTAAETLNSAEPEVPVQSDNLGTNKEA